MNIINMAPRLTSGRSHMFISHWGAGDCGLKVLETNAAVHRLMFINLALLASVQGKEVSTKPRAIHAMVPIVEQTAGMTAED